MTSEKRSIAVRFFGGAGNYTTVLEECCTHILTSDPTETALIEWVKSNTEATSTDGIRNRLRFLEALELLEIEPERVRVTETGITWVSQTDPEVLFERLDTTVYGFETALAALQNGPKTDAELGDIIANTHAEVNWNDPSGPAQHRGWLQSLGYVERLDGRNSLTDSGRTLARRRTSDNPDLERQTYYTQTDLEEAFDTSFGSYIKGINPRTDDDGELSYIIVKAREDGPYSDELDGERFTYIGEGVPSKGDQTLTGANKALLEQAEGASVPVYFFYQPADRSDLRYEGLVSVVDVRYVNADERDRRVYEFTMERLDLEHPTAFETLAASVTAGAHEGTDSNANDGATAGSDPEPALTAAEDEYTETQRRVRSSAFAKRVKSAYDFRCAICDRSRESPAGTVDIEAAHIYPKQENGRDFIRNGLALCRLHHWAFDAGWLAISDEYRILVADRPELEGYEEFSRLEGAQISVPPTEDERPHATFLAAHRELHGFESV
ncbi:putative restriction endonuclease [Natronorubrum sediminis]|uniref:Putative restriction endonuclease n=1 Tax=Natronorubrum sediminis TaxID=640943 RepID=A0A1H6FRW6_9EURY|nr:HNH endonuclease [Natronorubrum sediminis]SEH13052.1 putative restriction endonuclease [Natronorubrum sediminis]